MSNSNLTVNCSNRIEKTLFDFCEKVLEPNKIDFLIVGSLALKKLGMECDEPHDIDMEVICTSEQEKIFKLLSDSRNNDFYETDEKIGYLSKAERRMDKVTWSKKPYIFEWCGVLINIWVVSEFSHPYITLQNGINYAQIMSVIRKKIAYNRQKDMRFLIRLATRFLKMCEVSESD